MSLAGRHVRFSGGEEASRSGGRTETLSLCPACNDATDERQPALRPDRERHPRHLVAERVRVASSSLDRTVGLLRTPEVKPGEGLWIERSPSIHMFFMPYAIDAVFVGRQGRVTKVVPNLRPWRVVWWARGARDCLELGPARRPRAARSRATSCG